MDPYLHSALNEAKRSLTEKGVPIGALLVRRGDIVARGHDKRLQHDDPMLYAELDCLSQAGRLKSYSDLSLYVTLMPSWIGAGAVAQLGIPKVIVGDSKHFPGGEAARAKVVGFLKENGVEVTEMNDPACVEVGEQFVRDRAADAAAYFGK